MSSSRIQSIITDILQHPEWREDIHDARIVNEWRKEHSRHTQLFTQIISVLKQIDPSFLARVLHSPVESFDLEQVDKQYGLFLDNVNRDNFRAKEHMYTVSVMDALTRTLGKQVFPPGKAICVTVLDKETGVSTVLFESEHVDVQYDRTNENKFVDMSKHIHTMSFKGISGNVKKEYANIRPELYIKGVTRVYEGVNEPDYAFQMLAVNTRVWYSDAGEVTGVELESSEINPCILCRIIPMFNEVLSRMGKERVPGRCQLVIFSSYEEYLVSNCENILLTAVYYMKDPKRYLSFRVKLNEVDTSMYRMYAIDRGLDLDIPDEHEVSSVHIVKDDCVVFSNRVEMDVDRMVNSLVVCLVDPECTLLTVGNIVSFPSLSEEEIWRELFIHERNRWRMHV